MASPDVAIALSQIKAVPQDYTVPPAAELVPLSLTASFDGTSAAGTFQPLLEVLTPGGQVVVRCPTQISLAAGASADVSWFPGVAGAGSENIQTFVGARVYLDTTQTIANNVNVNCTYNQVQFDEGGMVNLTTNPPRLTAVIGGWYVVNMGAGFDPNATGNRLGIVIRNGTYVLGTGEQLAADSKMAVTVGGARTPVSAITVVFLAAGDYITAGVQQSSGGNLNIGGQSQYQARSFMAAALIGVG